MGGNRSSKTKQQSPSIASFPTNISSASTGSGNDPRPQIQIESPTTNYAIRPPRSSRETYTNQHKPRSTRTSSASIREQTEHTHSTDEIKKKAGRKLSRKTSIEFGPTTLPEAMRGVERSTVVPIQARALEVARALSPSLSLSLSNFAGSNERKGHESGRRERIMS